MIAYITGKIIDKDNLQLTVMCENAGVGYAVFCPTAPSMSDGDNVSLFVRTIVSENDISLYGFKTKEERTMFERLISVNGIGPRMGVNIISMISTADLINAIISKNVSAISSIKGVGKKTAEKIIFSLEEKLQKEYSGTIATGKDIPDDDEAAKKVIQSLIFFGIPKQKAVEIYRTKYNHDLTLEQNIRVILNK